MTISIWRYCHLILALASSLFLLIASITGVILAVEPIIHQTKDYGVSNLENVSLATAIVGLKENYEEVFFLEVEASGFVKASVLNEDFETLDIYINPKTGEQLGEVTKRPEIYRFATNLHRSLFLKSVGRFFVGLVSFLLFIIAITGIFLLAKRQGGIKKLFSKVQKEYFEMRYHVILSRWLLLPIIILSLTGVYLSAERFNLLPNSTIELQEVAVSNAPNTYGKLSEIPFFKETKLSEIRNVAFPFSDAADDYFHIALNNKEVLLNQQTGAIVSSASYPFVTLASRLSIALHTGDGSVLWSIVLLVASASIVFFMYSGFVMTLKRRKKLGAISKKLDKDVCEYIILVGSETGTSFDFAIRLQKALTLKGKDVFLTELNNYSTYAKAKHIIVLTSTYGEGEPPTNARKFKTLFEFVKQPNTINFSVVGFGSLNYPDYCQFAKEIDLLFQTRKGFHRVLPLYKIDNSNFTDFQKWAQQWSKLTAVPLKIDPPKQSKKLKLISFKVVERSELNIDNTFLLRIKPKRKIKFTSGDLLSILPAGIKTARQYSIAKIGDEILLSIKKHEFGLGSSFLFKLNKNDIFKAAVETNSQFHFPIYSESAVLISNGTGIAPFLGMINENKNADVVLLWGGRVKESSNIYDNFLELENLKNPNLSLHKCYSRKENKQYVQDLVLQQQTTILKTIKNGGTIMICGSLTMQHGVMDVIEKILINSDTTLDTLINNGHLKMDCY